MGLTVHHPMEVHMEPPPPGGPPDAPGATQPFANPDQIMQPPPHVPPTAPQPIVSLPKHPHFPLPGVMRPPSPRNVPLTRSSGLHPDDTGPKAKLRFPSTSMKIPVPVQKDRLRFPPGLEDHHPDRHVA